MDNRDRRSGGVSRDVYAEDFEGLRKHWVLAVILGIVLIVLGAIAISISTVVTLASMMLLGWFLLIGGIVQGIHAFSHRRWHFFPELLLATFYVVVGILIIGNPATAVLALTLMMIAFFLVAGIFRIVAASTIRFSNRWSMFASGIISLLLGLLLWTGWPTAALWVIGLFIGIELIFNGWSMIMLGLAARHMVPVEVPHSPGSRP
jgi:uncharacterized membrane protein HdeD (DUF308 family)